MIRNLARAALIVAIVAALVSCQTTTTSSIDSDWTHLQVGTDIEPGRYVAPGGPNCAWVHRERSSTSPTGFDILGRDGAINPRVEVLPTDEFFSFQNCGEWSESNLPPSHIRRHPDQVVDVLLPAGCDTSLNLPCYTVRMIFRTE